MRLSRSAYAAEVIQLFLEDPNTPEMPSPADWKIAAELCGDRRNADSIPIECGQDSGGTRTVIRANADTSG